MTSRLRFWAALALPLAVAACDAGPGDEPYTGYAEIDFAYIAAPAGGWLEEVAVKEGDKIAKGAPLFRLDTVTETAQRDAAAARLEQAKATARDMATGARPAEIDALEAQLKEAGATLSLAQSERDRLMPLVRKGAASKAAGDNATSNQNAAKARTEALSAQIETARLAARTGQQEAAAAAVKAAAEDLAIAQHRLDERTVTARMNAQVEMKLFQTGEYVSPGAPVLALAAEGTSLKVKFFVPQDVLSHLKPGDEIEVAPSSSADKLKARVSFISAEAEFTPPIIYSATSRDKLVFMVEAEGPALQGLRAGQPVDVYLP